MNMKGFLVHALQALGNSVLLENKFSRNSSMKNLLKNNNSNYFIAMSEMMKKQVFKWLFT